MGEGRRQETGDRRQEKRVFRGGSRIYLSLDFSAQLLPFIAVEAKIRTFLNPEILMPFTIPYSRFK